MNTVLHDLNSLAPDNNSQLGLNTVHSQVLVRSFEQFGQVLMYYLLLGESFLVQGPYFLLFGHA